MASGGSSSRTLERSNKSRKRSRSEDEANNEEHEENETLDSTKISAEVGESSTVPPAKRRKHGGRKNFHPIPALPGCSEEECVEEIEEVLTLVSECMSKEQNVGPELLGGMGRLVKTLMSRKPKDMGPGTVRSLELLLRKLMEPYWWHHVDTLTEAGADAFLQLHRVAHRASTSLTDAFRVQAMRLLGFQLTALQLCFARNFISAASTLIALLEGWKRKELTPEVSAVGVYGTCKAAANPPASLLQNPTSRKATQLARLHLLRALQESTLLAKLDAQQSANVTAWITDSRASVGITEQQAVDLQKKQQKLRAKDMESKLTDKMVQKNHKTSRWFTANNRKVMKQKSQSKTRHKWARK